MEASVKTQTKTSVSRKGDKITIKEVETTTTTRKGMAPEVKVVERVKEYDANNLPDNIREQIGDLANDDPGSSQKGRKLSSQGWSGKDPAGPSTQENLDKKVKDLPAATQITPVDQAKLNEDCVNIHNDYRQKHGCPPLTYSKQLADFAQNWAENLATNQRFEHREDDNVGENLYMFYSSNPSAVATAGDACASWYSEIKNFKFGKEPKNMSAGHFTQMIWKSSKKVGMGRAKGPTGKQIIVANYEPPGNFIGSFAANVPPLIS